jgi:phosphate transport system permease protein
MHLYARKTMDRALSGVGVLSVLLMAAALLALLIPIVVRGVGAYVFRGTVEHRRFLLERFARGDRGKVKSEVEAARQARQPVYDMVSRFEAELAQAPREERRRYRAALSDVKEGLRALLGPMPGETEVLPHNQYGQTRWDGALAKLRDLTCVTTYDYSNPAEMGRKVSAPRADEFRGTALEALFPYVEKNLSAMLRPRWTLYWGFLTDPPVDAFFLGGIWPAVVGTLYLTLGTMLIAGPMGILAALYLAEYAGTGWLVSLLRSCISTLAGVPSIVFGLFGLAFFINTLHVPKSVLAGSLTLAVLVLPTVIRASEEAIRAVPGTYREAALSLGAGRLRTALTVVLPAALPGVLTSIIISMGRAAGETAAIIFTAAISWGAAPKLWEVFTHTTMALPWSVFNLCTEHTAADEIRHVQFGMVLTLIVLVLLLNVTAIVLRARITSKLRG